MEDGVPSPSTHFPNSPRLCTMRRQYLFDDVGTQMWYMIDDHTYGEANEAHARFIGCRPEDVAFKSLYELLPENEARVCHANTTKTLETDEAVESIEEAKNAEGEMRILSIKKRAKRKADGSLDYIVCTGEDITEQKRAEEAIELMSERLTLAMDAGEHGFWDIDLLRKTSYFSPRYCEIHGHNERTDNFEDILEHIHGEDRDQVVELMKKHMMKGEKFEVEYRVLRDGGEKWISARGKEFMRDCNGKLTRAVGVAVDISNWKIASRDLRYGQYAKRLKDICWYYYEVDENVVPVDSFFSPTAETLLELEPGTLNHDMVKFYSYIDKEDLPKMTEILSTLTTKATDACIEYRVITATGRVRWISSRVTSYMKPENNHIWFVGSTVDITERKKIEQMFERRAHQQAAVAKFGVAVNHGMTVNEMLRQSSEVSSHVLGGAICEIFQHDHNKNCFVLRTRAKDGKCCEVDSEIILESDAQELLDTLNSTEAIIHGGNDESKDSNEEDLIRVMVSIPGSGNAFGVLSVEADSKQEFGSDDGHFLQSIANIMGVELQQQASQEALKASEERYRTLFEGNTDS